MIRWLAKNLYWSLYGIFIKNPTLPSTVKSILFICSGNICRSPFAEYVANKHGYHLNSLKFSSAGINVDEPKTPPQDAIATAEKFGIDLASHRSRPVDYDLIESFDMIVAMEAWQYIHIKKIFVEFENKMFLMPLFLTGKNSHPEAYHKYNIQDPYGRGMDVYHKCFENIDRCVSALLSDIHILDETEVTKF